ncbi:MAG: hypothetical protein CMD69_03490 [Gammaproteobacteria bacterium]|nr:hypothetical protein [Gammaproteobacteria bacterium]|tara:strand:+ start:673 stop:1077 length:405 start_codon:yes stop_codon:yes gene_type:complete
MSKTEIPEGYKPFDISQPHIDSLGPGFYKKEEGDQLVLGFYVKKENLNGYGSAHGGLLMALADFTLATSAMRNSDRPVTTVSFHSEFINPAPMGSLLEIRAKVTKKGKSLAFSKGNIKVGDDVILNFGGVLKIL